MATAKEFEIFPNSCNYSNFTDKFVNEGEERTEDIHDLDDRILDGFGLTLTQTMRVHQKFKELAANSKPESTCKTIEAQSSLESPPEAGPSLQCQSVSRFQYPSPIWTGGRAKWPLRDFAKYLKNGLANLHETL